MGEGQEGGGEGAEGFGVGGEEAAAEGGEEEEGITIEERSSPSSARIAIRAPTVTPDVLFCTWLGRSVRR